MFSQQPPGSVRRPPVSRNDSSSSLLHGMEKVIPSFQEFVKRTPPPDHAKPLPPVPLIPRRASGGWSRRSRSPSTHNGRRASSVYSRTVSMWQDDAVSFSSADFADDPMPPLPILQPLAYSSSTSQLGDITNPKGQLAEPRTYSPLIGTPSPTVSRGRTPESTRSALLTIEPPVSRRTSRKPVQTVSLEQAKRAHHAPGAVHLLPEELLAQTLKKRRSHEPLMESMAMSSPVEMPDLPGPPTFVDTQGRRRTVVPLRHQSIAGLPISNPMSPDSAARYVYGRSFKVGDGPERQMSSRLAEQEERGRARERGRRISGSIKRFASGRKPGRGVEGVDTNGTAEQYRGLVTSPLTSRPVSPEFHDTDSDDSLKTKMKLVPQPLFRTKPPAKLPGVVTRRFGRPSRSPHGHGSSAGSSFGRRKSSNGSNPFALSLCPASSHRRQSTSGSIPISPPVDMLMPRSTPDERRNPSPLRYESPDARESAYYPFVASRKDKRIPPRSNQDVTSTSFLPSPLYSGTASQPFTLPQWTPNSHPGGIRRTDSGDSNMSSKSRSARHLLQRVAQGATKYADLLIRTPETSNAGDYFPPQATPSFPHLLPSPVPQQNHLGCSTKAKTAFDEARTSLTSPTSYFKSPPATPQYTHFAAPARPLDEAKIGLREDEGRGRKASIFGGMLEGWMEGKAERRREDLKKIITVLPLGQEGVGARPRLGRSGSAFGWM